MVQALFKWLVIALFSVVVLVAGWKTFLFDEAALRQQISEEVKLSSGHALEINQPLELSLLPILSLATDEIRLKRKGQPEVVVEGLYAEIAMMPLLSQQLVLSQLQAKVDGALWQGSARAEPQGESARVRFDLQGEQLDLDRYLPKSEQGAAADPVAGSAAGIVQLPLEPLRALDLQGQIRLGKLLMAGAEITDITLKMRAKEGVIDVGPMDAQLYGGDYKSSMQADLQGALPKVSLDESLQEVDLGSLVRAGSEVESIRGQLFATAQLSATGVETGALIESLNGNVKVVVKEGAIIGFNLNRVIRQGKALIEGKAPAEDNEPNETRFDDLKASLRVEQGRLTTKDLMIETSVMVLNGAGWIELSSQMVDYRLTAQVHEEMEKLRGSGLEKFAGQSFPIEIKGLLSEPKIKADIKEIVKASLRKKLQDKIGAKMKQLLGKHQQEESGNGAQSATESPKEQLKKNFGNMLQKLF